MIVEPFLMRGRFSFTVIIEIFMGALRRILFARAVPDIYLMGWPASHATGQACYIQHFWDDTDGCGKTIIIWIISSRRCHSYGIKSSVYNMILLYTYLPDARFIRHRQWPSALQRHSPCNESTPKPLCEFGSCTSMKSQSVARWHIHDSCPPSKHSCGDVYVACTHRWSVVHLGDYLLPWS